MYEYCLLDIQKVSRMGKYLTLISTVICVAYRLLILPWKFVSILTTSTSPHGSSWGRGSGTSKIIVHHSFTCLFTHAIARLFLRGDTVWQKETLESELIDITHLLWSLPLSSHTYVAPQDKPLPCKYVLANLSTFQLGYLVRTDVVAEIKRL